MTRHCSNYRLRIVRPTLATEKIWTPREVGALFRVDPKTASRWALKKRIPSFKTPGGHHRFTDSDVRAAYRVEFGTNMPPTE